MTLKISHSQVSTQPNPTHQNLKKTDPTYGWTQPMTNSEKKPLDFDGKPDHVTLGLEEEEEEEEEDFA